MGRNIILRLWHQKLIRKLPRQQLLGLHREICGMRGKGWGQNHSTVNYVWDYATIRLITYHFMVLKEMEERGYNPNQKWWEFAWRGKNMGYDENFVEEVFTDEFSFDGNIFPEHDDQYLKECIGNLMKKGVVCRFLEEIKE